MHMSNLNKGQWVPIKMRDGIRVKPVKDVNGISIQLYPKKDGSVEPHIACGTMLCGGGNWNDTPWNETQKAWMPKLGVMLDGMNRNVYVIGHNGKRISKATGETLTYCINVLETAANILSILK
jgi:hypothetical protein